MRSFKCKRRGRPYSRSRATPELEIRSNPATSHNSALCFSFYHSEDMGLGSTGVRVPMRRQTATLGNLIRSFRALNSGGNYAKPVLAVVLLTTLLAVSIGCSRKPDDETVAKDIQQKLAADPDTKDANMTVALEERASHAERTSHQSGRTAKAEQIAKAEPGVSAVDDEIAIQMLQLQLSAETATAPAAAAPAPTQTPPPPAEKPKPQPVVIPAGTVLDVKLTQPLSSKTAQPGDPFTATLADPIVAHGKTVIPAGANVTGKVVDAKSKGKVKGEARWSCCHQYHVHGKPIR